jgi:hypothetical protein
MSSPYTLLKTEEEENAYDAGVIDGRDKERQRILDLLQAALANHTLVLKLRPTRSDSDMRHTICRTYQEAIALIKGNNK